jgi:hypothetical protein
MERRRWVGRTAWGGGIAMVAGIVLFALFSDAGGSCTANVIVLSDGVIGPHGCAASSIASHAGIGLMVLGAALLVGACVLSVMGRTEQTAAAGSGTEGRASGATTTAVDTGSSQIVWRGSAEPPREESQESEEHEEVVALPPGWYGNPANRNGSVQWWDGHRLVDRPPPGRP